MIKNMITSVFQLKYANGKNRVEYLDFLRGLTMILVLLHHSAFPYGDWILAFHMPFIFLLSGYTEYLLRKSTSLNNTFLVRGRQLLVPYFFFEFGSMMLWYLQCIINNRETNVLFALRDIILCLDTDAYEGLYGRFWFFFGMFVASIYFGIVKRASGVYKWKYAVWAAIALGMSWVTSTILQIRLPFHMDTAFYAAFFLIAGYTLGANIKWLLNGKPLQILCVCGSALFLMCLCMKTGGVQCYMFENSYGNYWTTLFAAICGCIAFLGIGKWMLHVLDKLPVMKKFVLWYGYHSMLVYPVHIIIRFFMWFFLPEEWCQWYCIFAGMLFLTIPVVNFLTTYLPFTAGKVSGKRKKIKNG